MSSITVGTLLIVVGCILLAGGNAAFTFKDAVSSIFEESKSLQRKEKLSDALVICGCIMMVLGVVIVGATGLGRI